MSTLYHGDCLVEMNKIGPASVDLLAGDLPYGTTACKWDTVISFEPLWVHFKRVLKPRGAVVLFGSEPFSSHLRLSNLKWYKYDWVWDKQSGGAFVQAKTRPLQTHENICVFGNGTITYNPIMTAALTKNIRPVNNGSSSSLTNMREGQIARSAENYNPSIRYPKTVVSFSRYSAECNPTKRVHPTQKPVALLEYLIRTYTNPGDTVFDPVMGSGTTGHACANLDRHFIGIELDANYFRIASDRIAKAERAARQLEMELT